MKPRKPRIRKPITPRSRIVSALRRLWLTSRERHAALKREDYCCERCGRKQSVAKGRELKLEVHHRDGIPDWDALEDLVRRRLLPPPDRLEVLCKECHTNHHQEE
jgi:hypothetical protein